MNTSRTCRSLLTFALLLAAAALVRPIPARAQGIFVPQPRGSGESLDEGARGALADPEMLGNVVYTRMGDELRGRVRAITPSGKLQFAAPYLSGDASLLRFAIERIVFKNPAAEPAIDRLFLVTGERIAGEVQEMDDETVLIKAGSAGYLRVRRPLVERIQFGAGSDLLVEADFSGKSMAPFRAVEGDWSTEDGTLRAPYDANRGGETSVAAMELGQSDALTATAVVDARDRAMNFDIVLFSDEIRDGRGNNCVLATFYRNRVNVQGIRNGNHYTIGDDRFQAEDAQEMNLRMSYDPERARIQVWVNGEKVNQYVVREPINNGQHVSIVSRGPLSVHRFALLKGVVPPPANQRKRAQEKTTVYGADGEHFSAKALRIKDNKVELETEFATIRWDLKQLDEVLFSKDELEEAEPAGNAVVRTSASKFIVQLKGMDEEQVRCASPLYGEFTIDRAALREILLHEME